MHVWIGGWFGLSLGLLGLLPTVLLHTSFYIVCHFLLFQLHSAEAIEAVCLARLVWPGGLSPLQPRRVIKERTALSGLQKGCRRANRRRRRAAGFLFSTERLSTYHLIDVRTKNSHPLKNTV